MKTNIFVVSLLALVKTLIVTICCFLLMLLFFNDSMSIFHRDEETFLYIFLGIFFYSVGCIAFVFSILLPMYYIDKKQYDLLSFPELFSRHAPIVAAIATLLCGLAALIAGKNGLAEGAVQCNIFTVYVMAFTGLMFYEMQIRRAIDKANPKPVLHGAP